jgi:hypothetical protein
MIKGEIKMKWLFEKVFLIIWIGFIMIISVFGLIHIEPMFNQFTYNIIIGIVVVIGLIFMVLGGAFIIYIFDEPYPVEHMQHM